MTNEMLLGQAYYLIDPEWIVSVLFQLACFSSLTGILQSQDLHLYEKMRMMFEAHGMSFPCTYYSASPRYIQVFVVRQL